MAVLERNKSGDFAVLGRFFAKRQQERDLMFRILEVDYYQNADNSVLADCLNGDYRRVIVDYGSMTEAGLCDCARCDRNVSVGALSEWKAEAFLEALKMDGKRDKSWKYAVSFGSEETRKELERMFHVHCLRIPASVDAFAVTRADMDFFRRILE